MLIHIIFVAFYCCALSRCKLGTQTCRLAHSRTHTLFIQLFLFMFFFFTHSLILFISHLHACIFCLLMPDCVCIWIPLFLFFLCGTELTAKSNLQDSHINRQIQIMESPHENTTQIYPDDKIWCGWQCLQWKIIGMSQHVSSIMVNDVQKRKVTAEDWGIV